MAEQTYAVIDASGTIVNLVLWDGVAPWTPGEGMSIALSDGTAQVGGHWDGQTFSPPAGGTEDAPLSDYTQQS